MSENGTRTVPQVVVVGAGPAGLIAADRLSAAGLAVTIIERMPSPARKLLMAGRGGLNLTHGEAMPAFLSRYRDAATHLEPAIAAFDPAALRQWCAELGIETFVGSSDRVFPTAMKASPLVRALLGRLAARGVELNTRWTWTGLKQSAEAPARWCLSFETPDGAKDIEADAVLLALGGASWPRLGSNGGWVPLLERHGVTVTPLTPANAGVLINWSELLKQRFAGTPLKRIAVSVGGTRIAGEAMITARGLEGGAVYALSAELRAAFEAHGSAELVLDLRPDLDEAALATRLARPRGKQSLSNHLRKAAGLPPSAIALLSETGERTSDPLELARRIKGLALAATGFSGMDRAISTAGGIAWSEIDADFGLNKLPGVHVAGEMIDWEAPTGGYLLQASFASGIAAADGIARALAGR
ncbi:NAD(P)/FAD-dependent oxidoreductase [Stappia indica]|uniref:NAD(P)/FAD-dependent oxidoreductase n=1 Tax=Stappia indica TaxID=538381 RepID=UPI00082FFF0B|nr:TIGR03862 family flavoprotein [Stappia indica]